MEFRKMLMITLLNLFLNFKKIYLETQLIIYFLKQFFFIWRMIDLQCCVNFCCTRNWISYTQTHVHTHTHTHTHIYTHAYNPSLLDLPPKSNPFRSSWSPELSALCYRAAPHWLSILHMVVYICQCSSLNSSHTLLPLLCTQACSLHGNPI